MRRRLSGAAIVVLLMGGSAFAQSAHPLPQPPSLDQQVAAQTAPRPDLFQAPPGTYAPQYDHPVPPASGAVIYGPWGPYPQWAQPIVVSPTVVVSPPPPAEPKPAAPEPPPRAAAAPPGPPKTFYVIPGCYAGDRRPEPARLPRGCSLSKLRAIPPAFSRVTARAHS